MSKTKELIRISCRESEAEGRDEGRFFRYKEIDPTPPKILRRMARCAGCHDNFYNHRANCTENHCWSLKSDNNFRGRGAPKCYH